MSHQKSKAYYGSGRCIGEAENARKENAGLENGRKEKLWKTASSLNYRMYVTMH